MLFRGNQDVDVEFGVIELPPNVMERGTQLELEVRGYQYSVQQREFYGIRSLPVLFETEVDCSRIIPINKGRVLNLGKGFYYLSKPTRVRVIGGGPALRIFRANEADEFLAALGEWAKEHREDFTDEDLFGRSKKVA